MQHNFIIIQVPYIYIFLVVDVSGSKVAEYSTAIILVNSIMLSTMVTGKHPQKPATTAGDCDDPLISLLSSFSSSSSSSSASHINCAYDPKTMLHVSK